LNQVDFLGRPKFVRLKASWFQKWCDGVHERWPLLGSYGRQCLLVVRAWQVSSPSSMAYTDVGVVSTNVPDGAPGTPRQAICMVCSSSDSRQLGPYSAARVQHGMPEIQRQRWGLYAANLGRRVLIRVGE
jgi:hypothetical protein